MQRYTKVFTIDNVPFFKQQLLQWAQQFREVVFLESNNYKAKYSSHEAVLAFDAFTLLQTDSSNAFNELNDYKKNCNDWLFGYLTYDLKNNLEKLESLNDDNLQFPDLLFFHPKKLIFFEGHSIRFEYLNMCSDEIDSDFDEIISIEIEVSENAKNIQVQSKLTFNEYEEGFNKVMNHIQRGDIYEANYCMEFFVKDMSLNCLDVFWKLNEISEPPFACFAKINHHFVMSASPERYVKKEGLKIISQPIKGTARRGNSQDEDLLLKDNLAANEKEKSENVMIVDLVRNDLSRTAIKNSVVVEELFGIYTFKQVHQMISTVVSEVSKELNPLDVLETTFPMGSMTGAPKLSAMKIIESAEKTKRGLYSGAIGYFTPTNDFDFNVVIRTILYNKRNNYASFSVGSAITINANATDEYNECLLKAQALKQVLTQC